MAILNRNVLKPRRVQIDLAGPGGNAYALMGIGQDLCKQLNRDWEPVQKEMTSGDYENLLKVFDREFGEYVDLIRPGSDEEED